MNFDLDKEKAIEALVYIASRMPGVGRFHASKILYYAERDHLRGYGRPITGDRFIAMDNGPVPSFAYRVMGQDLRHQEDKRLAAGSIVEYQDGKYPAYKPARQPDLSYFSQSDLQCLDAAIEYCRDKTFGQLSDETHHHSAWKNVGRNAEMKFADFFDGVDDEMVSYARAFASHGVL